MKDGEDQIQPSYKCHWFWVLTALDSGQYFPLPHSSPFRIFVEMSNRVILYSALDMNYNLGISYIEI